MIWRGENRNNFEKTTKKNLFECETKFFFFWETSAEKSKDYIKEWDEDDKRTQKDKKIIIWYRNKSVCVSV